MGQVVAHCVADREDCMVVAGLDVNPSSAGSYPVFGKAQDCTVKADVIIDFSHPSVTQSVLDYAVKQGLPAVIATTGLMQGQIDGLHRAAEAIPVFFTANMSLGVNLLAELCKRTARVLGNDFDIEIIEKHHNQKVDAPSGTALMLAEAISGELPQEAQYTYDRHSRRAKRSKNEIGIHAVRGGTIVGEHEVLFAGRDEVITISHSAMSRDVFGVGAINAALFLSQQKPGLYNMGDMV